ncbi:MAG: bifunctional UDP-4-keto-pentose/UDP-xylose synthase [Desulfobulbaceae bacterium]
MKILNLGAGGFIGSHLTTRLLAEGHQVTGVDINGDKLDTLAAHHRFTYLGRDIRDAEGELAELIAASDLVVDLIAHANPSLYVSRPLDVFHLNFSENLKIAETCVRQGKRLIQFSSCEVYGKTVASIVPGLLANPDDPDLALFAEESTPFILGPVNRHRWIYSCAKQLLERVLHAYGLAGELIYTIIRPFNFIGPRIDYLPREGEGVPRVFSHFMGALLHGGPMRLVNGGRQRRCYTYIDDAVDCLLRIVDNPGGVCDRQIFNIGSPANEISIKGLALLMQELYVEQFGGDPFALPPLLEVSGEEFYGDGYDDSDRRIPDISKAEHLLNWRPRFDLRRTVADSMRYYVEQARQR